MFPTMKLKVPTRSLFKKESSRSDEMAENGRFWRIAHRSEIDEERVYHSTVIQPHLAVCDRIWVIPGVQDIYVSQTLRS